jgi:hypothetical protein
VACRPDQHCGQHGEKTAIGADIDRDVAHIEQRDEGIRDIGLKGDASLQVVQEHLFVRPALV